VDIASISSSDPAPTLGKAPQTQTIDDAASLTSPFSRQAVLGVALATLFLAAILPSVFVTYGDPTATVVQWGLYGGGILFAAVGILQIAFPSPIWCYTRYVFRSAGIATTEKPESGALAAIRVRGVLMLVFAIAFLVFARVLLSQFLDRLKETQELLTNVVA
jgi:hypothetical protein